MSPTAAGAGRARRSVVILGADAFLAALPATPTQVFNACFAAGFDDAVPASWGDELIAVACLDALAERGGEPAIACICPLVSEQLRGASGVETAAIGLASPPVATALYVRATTTDAVRITYVGDCPGAGDPSIDVHLSPQQFLSRLAERGVDLAAQPPSPARALRDRRRHYSIPGGVPASAWLGSEGIARTLVDLGEISDATREMRDALVDLGPRLGCVCSGALAGCAAAAAREAVTAIEPARSREEIVDHSLVLPIANGATPRRAAPKNDMSWGAFVTGLSSLWGGGPTTVARATSVAQLQMSRVAIPKRLGPRGRIVPRAYSAPRSRRRDSTGVDRALTSAELHRAPVEISREPAPELRHVTRPAPSASRSGLAGSDRAFLAGLVVAGSVIVASLTSVMTARGVRDGLALRAPAVRETVYVAAVARPKVASDSPVPAPAVPRPADDKVEERRAAAPSPGTGEPRSETVAAPPRPTPRKREREVAEAPPRRRAPEIEAAPTPSPRPAATASAAPSAAPPAPTLAPAPAPSASPAADAPKPAASTDSSSQQNAMVLQELRAIHAEIEERKRHVDSLTKALDSLKKVSSP